MLQLQVMADYKQCNIKCVLCVHISNKCSIIPGRT